MIEYDMRRWRPLFFTVWSGQALSLFGSRLVGFSVIWWLTVKTGMASTLALAAFMEMLPRMVLSALAGPLVDRWNRRHVMMAADSFVALATTALAFLFWLDAVQPWHVLGLLLVRSSGDVFHGSSMLASTTLMAPKDHLARVAGLNQTLEGAGNIAAPPLGAVLVSALPIQSILLIDVATAAVAVLILAMIRLPQPSPDSKRRRPPPFFTALAEGFQYLTGSRGLFFLFLFAAAVWMGAAPAWRFLPLLATKSLGGDAIHLGMMSSAFGIGMVAGGAILAVWGGFKRRITTCAVSRLGTATAYLLLGLTPSGEFAVAVVACGLFGVTFSISMGAQRALIQSTVPAALQGRVFSMFTSALNLMQPIALGAWGLLGDRLGSSAIFFIGGVATFLIALSMLLTPSLMHMEDSDAVPAEAGST